MSELRRPFGFWAGAAVGSALTLAAGLAAFALTHLILGRILRSRYPEGSGS